jgi:cytidine deaminase
MAQGPDHVIDWSVLHAAAATAAARSYSPYSSFPVGAAALVDDGRVISGCNIENASYGLTLCAECSLISALHMGGGGRLVAVVTCTLDPESGEPKPVMPCGRCRQLLWEHGGADCLLNGNGRIQPMSDVLPGAFDANELSA